VPKQGPNNLFVHETLANHKCILEFREALTILVLIGYLNLWEILEEVHLNLEVLDQDNWIFKKRGTYSYKSAYMAFFFCFNQQIQY